MAFKFTLILDKGDDGTCSFKHHIEGDPTYFEIIGLLEIHKQDLVRFSRERAKQITKSKYSCCDVPEDLHGTIRSNKR